MKTAFILSFLFTSLLAAQTSSATKVHGKLTGVRLVDDVEVQQDAAKKITSVRIHVAKGNGSSPAVLNMCERWISDAVQFGGDGLHKSIEELQVLRALNRAVDLEGDAEIANGKVALTCFDNTTVHVKVEEIAR